ncbi:MAG: methyltransferase domain-containing protein [Candidatus Heimdallarchaeum endolithica]|uniref:tRNA (guanine(26)-N(2))-dimethyltransferase n=1 Tax=Candidatus Heimdallarchaeum endolithica TaxID=2876572 RepID=A0A9Y1BT44_9ARCH|nr:MAG: methyltransferase domain-containing protein [Candidatus Heimdallarchaeum endolithica]
MNKQRLVEINEGKTSFTLERDSETIYDSSVFYNPKMSINRDLALLHLYTIGNISKKRLTILDPFTGSGIRSFRIINELPKEYVKKVIISDISERAIENVKLNIEKSFNDERIVVHRENAFNIIAKQIFDKENIDVIDLDPFGTPISFIEVAVRALVKNSGYLFLTATDHQVLCGKERAACLREYNSNTSNNYLCHEIALRILLYNILVSSGRIGVNIKPILSLQFEHFFRIHVRIEKGKKKANEQHKKLGFVYVCAPCSFFEIERIEESKNLEKCPICNKRLEKTGPLWLGPLGNKEKIELLLNFLDKIEFDHNNKKKIHSMLSIFKEEICLSPMFYNLPYLFKKYKKNGVSPKDMIDRLEKRGYFSTRTIFDPQSIRTDAPYYVVHNEIKKL